LTNGGFGLHNPAKIKEACRPALSRTNGGFGQKEDKLYAKNGQKRTKVLGNPRNFWGANRVEEPEGIVDQRFPRKFLPLNKFFYGVKQVPRMRYLLLCSVFNSLGFAPLESEPSIYHNSRIQVTHSGLR